MPRHRLTPRTRTSFFIFAIRSSRTVATRSSDTLFAGAETYTTCCRNPVISVLVQFVPVTVSDSPGEQAEPTQSPAPRTFKLSSGHQPHPPSYAPSSPNRAPYPSNRAKPASRGGADPLFTFHFSLFTFYWVQGSPLPVATAAQY